MKKILAMLLACPFIASAYSSVQLILTIKNEQPRAIEFRQRPSNSLFECFTSPPPSEFSVGANQSTSFTYNFRNDGDCANEPSEGFGYDIFGPFNSHMFVIYNVQRDISNSYNLSVRQVNDPNQVIMGLKARCSSIGVSAVSNVDCKAPSSLTANNPSTIHTIITME